LPCLFWPGPFAIRLRLKDAWLSHP
jgi:hypothetical protein